MPLVIANYNPEWPRLFEREAGEVAAGLGGVLGVEHVGSTAVPGQAALPTIDLLAGVDDPADVDAALLSALGYTESGEAEGAEHRLFWKGTEAYPTYHLHLVTHEGEWWTQALAFRDRLRDDLDLAERYAHEKRQLARQHADDPAAYAAAKADVIGAALQTLA